VVVVSSSAKRSVVRGFAICDSPRAPRQPVRDGPADLGVGRALAVAIDGRGRS
jgi:hypothetical protein